MAKKIIVYLVGAGFLLLTILGIALVIGPESTDTVSGITLIVLSIASGLIVPNPISIFGLIAGILILVLPEKVAGIALLVIGAGACIANPIVAKSKLNL